MLRSLLGLVGAENCVRRTLPPGIIFLFKLAWQSKVRLPLLIALAFMLSDYHLQLEINVDVHVREETVAGENNNHRNGDSDSSRPGPGVELHVENVVVIDVEEEEEGERENENTSSDSDWESSSSVDTVLQRLDDRIDRLTQLADSSQDR